MKRRFQSCAYERFLYYRIIKWYDKVMSTCTEEDHVLGVYNDYSCSCLAIKALNAAALWNSSPISECRSEINLFA